MALGPGKYDGEVTLVRKRTGARGVILVIYGGDKGSGFSVQADAITTMHLPELLRAMADQIEADMRGA